ncbi:MAG: GntR family transcriptional regulator [bacterium]|nr:GntR family transcriptional regulator [bacterium]
MNLADKTLNKDIPLPLYYQIKEILLDYIKHAEEGGLIPAEQELCQHFEVSRQTVRQAITELVSEGYLYRMKGKGTFISERKIRQEFLLVLDSFNDEMRRKGLLPTTKVLEFSLSTCDGEVGKALKAPEGSEVIRLRRLRFVNNEPFVLVLTFLPYDKLSDILSRDFERESLYHVIEEDYGYTIDRATMTFGARMASEYDAHLLGLKTGEATQFVERTTYLDDGNVIEYTTAEYRWDRNTFTLELKKEHL